jgi:phage/plasmid primase-like uncharacterized protein
MLYCQGLSVPDSSGTVTGDGDAEGKGGWCSVSEANGDGLEVGESLRRQARPMYSAQEEAVSQTLTLSSSRSAGIV